jgi:hypothetical protein
MGSVQKIRNGRLCEMKSVYPGRREFQQENMQGIKNMKERGKGGERLDEITE